MIKEEFLKSLKNYTTDGQQIMTLWNEVEKNYSKTGRHYHNLTHLDNLTRELIPFKERFTSWDTILVAIAYHDVVYNTMKSNNEEKSADLAIKRLSAISFPEKLITRCKLLILATKKHEASDEEINMFTDGDLSILGSDPETYKTYSKLIRLEYSLYPDILYNAGRKKVLTHFLKMHRIYKTNDFWSKYESTARINLQAELEAMNG